jgi:GTPase
MTTDEKKLKSGFVTLFGRSNVGKSTLLNTLVGTKLAAVTEKPQTTRNIIHGVLNDERGQVVFVDTPGVLKGKKTSMSGIMLKRARVAMQDIDLMLYVVDPTKPMAEEERYVLSLVNKLEIPKILVINKSDLDERKKKYLEDYLDLQEDFNAVCQLSALKGSHIGPLKDKIFTILPEGEQNYPLDQITNLNEKEWLAEIIREKIFLIMRQEIPYSTHVEVSDVEKKPDIIVIKATVYTSDSHYKKMIIGNGGRMIKAVGIKARQELEIALNTKIYIELEVETDKHWQKRV